ncbi:hypothetical protein NPIL_553701 [Nephila pilipes]|uniref:Uncharacterized protein n=1 Tax=Nephila pilipes TaxID=299642 RepID=A0A8X6MF16_NEPPI|nr:hypothetical protein NPIL_553701 [Nephila pilipes]
MNRVNSNLDPDKDDPLFKLTHQATNELANLCPQPLYFLSLGYYSPKKYKKYLVNNYNRSPKESLFDVSQNDDSKNLQKEKKYQDYEVYVSQCLFDREISIQYDPKACSSSQAAY